MSKTLTNDPADAVDEAVAGIVAVHPGLRLLEGHRVIIRADIDNVILAKKVTLLSGGGSGHEPSQGGFVGHGMLSAAVCGSVFTSPPPASILGALRAIQSPAGSLMIVTNYTGDRLTFGIALERAQLEGINVKMFIVGDDCALSRDTNTSTGRRGLCGTVIFHKIAGAMTEQGYCLDDIVATLQEVSINIGTMGVCLHPCSIPGQQPTFMLKENEMEFGLGVHGEAGAERTEVLSADDVVKRILNSITSQSPGYQYLQVKKGDKVALLVNNLGSTSRLELSVVANSAVRHLVDHMQLNVVKTFVGDYMTSLGMAGVSLTLMNIVNTCWEQCLDSQTSAPGWIDKQNLLSS